jgi:hypothetical protein
MVSDVEREASAAARQVSDLFMTYFTACAVRAAVHLGVAELVGDEPRSAAELAAAAKVDADSLARLLRGLAAAGIFREVTPRRFVHTPMSAALRRDAPGNARGTVLMFGLPLFHEAMGAYEHAIRTGRPAFERVHGSAHFWDLLRQRPDEAAAYNEGMASSLGTFDRVVEAADFANVKQLVDVGGGTGNLIARILAKNPAQRGVLFDIATVVRDAPALLDASGVSDRCAIVPGDMHAEVPRGADGYILKSILHGYPDLIACTILRRIREAMAPGARLFVIENVMPAIGEKVPVCATFDLFLLMAGRGGGKVRSRVDFEELFRRSRFQLERISPVEDDVCVLEASGLP